MKKIRLHRETIRSLDENKLGRILGGGAEERTDTSCKKICRENTNCWVGCRLNPGE